MKENGSKKIRVVAGIILVSIFSFQNVVPVIGSELLMDDAVTGGFIKAGVSTLFEEEADIVILNEADILIDESESAIDSFDTSLVSLGDEIVIDELDEDTELENGILKEDTTDIEESSDISSNDSNAEAEDGKEEVSEDNNNMVVVVRMARVVAGSESLTPEEEIELDMTGDKEISMADVVKMARHVAGYVEEP